MKPGQTAVIFVFTIVCYFQCVCAGAVGINAQAEKGRIISLSQGVQMVLKDSRLIEIALFDNDMAYQDTLLARSVLLPRLHVTADQTFNQYQSKTKSGGQETPTADKDPFSFGVDVYQTLFDFGKSLSMYRASNELLSAAQAKSESVVRVAMLEFIVAYFNLLEAEKMIAVAEKEMESLSSYLKDNESLYEQGVVVKNDLLPVKVKIADAKQRLIAARNEREIIAARLNNILALPLREKITVSDIQMQLLQFPDIEDAWKAAETQRPEIAFYTNQINASGSREKAKAVENFPVFFVKGGYAHTQNKYQVHESNASVKLGAKMDLYEGGAAKAELQKERLRYKQLNEQKDKLIEDIKFEIEDSFFGLKNACEKVSVAREALDQAEENVRFYRVKYNAGSATSTDVLEAITLQTKAQTNYYSADYELKRNYAKLMYSMGGDLISSCEKMEKETKK